MRKSAGLLSLISTTIFFPLTTLRAESVTIEGSSPSESVQFIMTASTTADALQAIHEKYGVEVTGSDNISGNDPTSTTYTGSITSIVGRLLRNQNFVIVRGNKNVTGIDRIQISGSTHAADPKNAPNNPPPQTPPMP